MPSIVHYSLTGVKYINPNAMIRFCESEAAKNLDLAAKFLRDPSIQKVEAPDLYWHNVKLAQKWGEKRAVLVEAAAKLKSL